jgi:hypothetical protein
MNLKLGIYKNGEERHRQVESSEESRKKQRTAGEGEEKKKKVGEPASTPPRAHPLLIVAMKSPEGRLLAPRSVVASLTHDSRLESSLQ